MFVVHGTNDTLVPVAVARHFVDRLRASSRAPVAYAELPRAQHAFDVLMHPNPAHDPRGGPLPRRCAPFQPLHHPGKKRRSRPPAEWPPMDRRGRI